jgi:phage terminase large subunit-like protein
MVEVAYDPALSQTFAHICDRDIPELPIVAVPQNNTTMSPFNTEYEATVVGENLLDWNPVWRWMLSNTTIKIGGTGLIHIEKIDHLKTNRRIDAVVTSSIAHGRLQAHLRQAPTVEYIPFEEYTY